MKFIELTLTNENKIFINVSKIIDIITLNEKTTISFSADYYYTVKESINEVMKKINN